MKWKALLGSLLIVGSLLAVGFSLNKQTEWGDPVPVGQGQMQTFVMLNGSGRPQAVGIHFTEDTLLGLPVEGNESVLELPAAIEATPFDHFALNWSPQGHDPTDVYTVPHFDLHFYMVSPQERAAIKAGTCTTEQDNRIPNPPGAVPVTCEVFDRAMQGLPADMLPPGYALTPAVEPEMGNHLVDLTAPEFNGQSFTHTWVYGAYGGELTFFEPMIAVRVLEQQADVCQAIKMPEVMPEAGWYPTRYCIEYLDQENAYTLSLESFRWFEATDTQVES